MVLDSNRLIHARRLKKSYLSAAGEQKVLRGIDLSVDRGSFVAIVGPSGCGKTTLLNLMGGLDRPDEGELWVNGIDLIAANDRDLIRYRRSQIGFIFQFYNLLPTLNAQENVEIGLEVLPIPPKERKERAFHYLQQVGLSEMAHKFPSQLSGGEQQRVAIARALAREPVLLLADEPTGNLDEESSGEIITLLQKLQHGKGITCLMVTHDLALAERVDHSLHILDGVIVPSSTPPGGSR